MHPAYTSVRSMAPFCLFSFLLALEKKWGDGGGRHWLVRMEWRPAGWSVCLPVLIFPCTIKSRSSLLTLAHPGGPGKRAVKRLWCGGVVTGVRRYWRWRTGVKESTPLPSGVRLWMKKGGQQLELVLWCSDLTLLFGGQAGHLTLDAVRL